MSSALTIELRHFRVILQAEAFAKFKRMQNSSLAVSYEVVPSLEFCNSPLADHQIFHHPQKRNPPTNLKYADIFRDFLSLTLVSAHQVTVLFSDRGTPHRLGTNYHLIHVNSPRVSGVNSPVRAFRSVGGGPPVIALAAGAKLVDVDGNEYIDYIENWDR